MISRSTNIKAALKSRQRGFLLNPYRFGVANPYQDLTTWTEVDPGNRITVTSPRVTWTNLPRNETAYLSKDFGVNYFGGDFQIDFDFNAGAAGVGGYVGFLFLTNTIAHAGGQTNMLHISQFNNAGTYQVRLFQLLSGVNTGTPTTVTAGTTYYCRFRRDESVGTFGTMYLHFATSSANRTVQKHQFFHTQPSL